MTKITLTESESKFNIPDYIKFKIRYSYSDEDEPILEIYDDGVSANSVHLIYACLTEIDKH